MRIKNAILALLFGVGFISMGTQIYLIREFLKVFGGNEVVTGLVLAFWMVVTGAGAWLSRFLGFGLQRFKLIFLIIVFLAFFPCLMPVELACIRMIIIPYGSAVSILEISFICLLIQLPFCLLNGYLFTVLSSLLGRNSEKILPDYAPNPASTAYTFESVGAMAAGVIVNFIFLIFFKSNTSLYLLTLLLLALASYSAFILLRFRGFIVFLLISVMGLVGLLCINLQDFTMHLLYPGQRVLLSHETPYGHVVVTGGDQQLNYYENGIPLFSTGNVISNEEHVHFAMAQHQLAGRILLISGGYAGMLDEVLKYHPDQIDYVELNPALIAIAGKYSSRPGGPNIFYHNKDARRYIATTSAKYDIILMNLPEPSTIQLNRYYTVEFLYALKRIMNPGAVVSFSLPTGSNYVSEKAGRLNGTIYNTLRSSFSNVLIVPATRNYYLASDSLLTLEIPSNIELKGINTAYVNKYYFDAKQLKERADYVMRHVSGEIQLNRDYHPVAFFYQMEYLLSFFREYIWILVISCVALFMLVCFNLNAINAGLFTGGFTVASLQVMLLVALQVNLGYLFQATGALIMVSMAGLAAGSFLATRMHIRDPLRYYLSLQLMLACFAIIISILIPATGLIGGPGWMVTTLICIPAFLTSFLAGMEYAVAAVIQPGNPGDTNSRNYAADLFGSAFGAFLFTIVMFPLLGLLYSGGVLAIMNLLSAALLFFRRRFYVPL